MSKKVGFAAEPDKGIVADARHANGPNKEWRPACEATGTLSRSNPKVRQQFEAWNRQFEIEKETAQQNKQNSQREKASQERVDPRWRDDDPERFVVRPFAVFRLTHDALRLGMLDICQTASTIFSNAMVLIKLKTQYEELVRTFEAYSKVEEGPNGLWDVLDDYHKSKGGKISELEGLSDYNTLIREEFSVQVELIELAVKGDHDAAGTVKAHFPEVSNLMEMCLQGKESIYTKFALAAKFDSDKKNGAKVKGALDNAREPLNSYAASYVTKQLARKRPFGNVKMYVASLHLGSDAAQFAAMSPSLQKAARNSKGESIWAQIEEYL